MEKFEIKMEKELDLEKILHRLRLFVFATAGTLTKDQSIFSDRMSRIVIKESSDNRAESSDKELERENDSIIGAARRLNLSSDKTDKRFFQLYKIYKAKWQAQTGVKKGAANDDNLLQVDVPIERKSEK